MYPKKAKEFYEEYGELNGYTEDEVAAVMDLYYNKLADRLRNITDVRIDVPGLGIFLFKYWKIDEYIEEHDKMIRTTGQKWALDRAYYELTKLYPLKEKIREEEYRKIVKKAERKLYDREKQVGRTLGEQGEDTDRDDQQVSEQGGD